MKTLVSILIIIFGSQQGFAQKFHQLNLADSLQTQSISLRRAKLKHLPEALFSFKNVEILDLRNNKLDHLPDRLSELKRLKIIKLSRNQFKHFPEVLKTLTQLEHIDLWDNQISDLHLNLEDLPHLTYLDISGILLSEDVYNRLQDQFQSIEFIASPPCDCMKH
ncbi:MAG: leucine-rich repeat domain-containing protein [Flavobacteriales bacterium]